MDAREVHIKFFQDAQRVDSYVHEDLQKNEVDLLMNTMMQRFIDERVRRNPRSGSKFQLEQPDVDDLEYIIEKDVELPLIIDQNRGYGYVPLPDNYMYLLNDRTRLVTSCGIDSITTVENSDNFVVIPLKESLNDSPYYSEFILTLNGLEAFNIQNFPEYYSEGLPEAEQIFEVKNLLIDYLRDNKPKNVTGVYFEKYSTEYYPYSLILTLSEPLDEGETNTLLVDGETTSLSTTVVEGLEKVENGYVKETNNRSIKTEHIHTSLHNNYYTKTSFREPVSTIAKGMIFVYFDKKFKPNSIIIDYIRIPRSFNIYLNQTFEIRDTFHSKIVDLAVESFKNTTEKQSAYEMKLKDNEIRRE
jgi:hypothetical protein